MLKCHWVITDITENEIDSVTMLAANHGLLCMHKIGIYGEERQHELYVIGSFWKYRSFKKALANRRKQ